MRPSECELDGVAQRDAQPGNVPQGRTGADREADVSELCLPCAVIDGDTLTIAPRSEGASVTVTEATELGLRPLVTEVVLRPAALMALRGWINQRLATKEAPRD